MIGDPTIFIWGRIRGMNAHQIECECRWNERKKNESSRRIVLRKRWQQSLSHQITDSGWVCVCVCSSTVPLAVAPKPNLNRTSKIKHVRYSHATIDAIVFYHLPKSHSYGRNFRLVVFMDQPISTPAPAPYKTTCVCAGTQIFMHRVLTIPFRSHPSTHSEYMSSRMRCGAFVIITQHIVWFRTIIIPAIL